MPSQEDNSAFHFPIPNDVNRLLYGHWMTKSFWFADTSCDSSSEFGTLPGLMTRSAPARGSHLHAPRPLAPPAAGRSAYSFPASSKDVATLAALGARHTDDVTSPSDSGSSLYAETELNDAPRPHADSDVSSETASSGDSGTRQVSHRRHFTSGPECAEDNRGSWAGVGLHLRGAVP